MNQTQRTLNILFLLAGHEYDGLRITDIAAQIESQVYQASRDIKLLEEEGLVEEIPGLDKRFRITPKLAQIARRVQINHEQRINRMDELNKRYSMNS